MKKIFKRIGNFVKTVQSHRNEPLHIEFVLSDYCNLNCRGCGHYSPLADKEFESLDILRRNASRLGQVLSGGLESVYLIGGETLLYPRLVEAISIVSKAFPSIPVRLFTNGLMLPRMSDEFWTAVREHDAEIWITRYPINFDYDAVEDLCRRQGVKYSVFGDRSQENSFFRFALDPDKKQNGRLSHFKCFNRGCISVIGDRIFPCSISGCVDHLNRKCSTDFRHEKGDWINVDDVRGISDIKRLRNRPVPFCGYCKPNPQPVAHGLSKRDVAEWVDL